MAFPGAGVIREEQLQCPICLQLLVDPVTTSCGHNYCQPCLGQYWAKSPRWRCPLCKEAFAQRPELRINTTLRDMVELFRQNAIADTDPSDTEAGSVPGPEGSVIPMVMRPLAKSGEVACDVCGGQRRIRALKSCLDCGTSFCALHLEAHQRAPALQKHVLTEPLADLEGRVCAKHRRPLTLYCRNDHTCVCEFCTEGEHKNHNTVPLEEEGKDRKTKLGKTQAELLEMILERLDKISEIKHSVELRKKSTEEEVAVSAELCVCLVRCVERSHEELQEALREQQEAAERQAEEEVQKLQDEITTLKTCSTHTVHLLHTPDSLHLLKADPSLCHVPEMRSWGGVRLNTHVCVEAALDKMEETLKAQLQSIPQRKLNRVQQYEVEVTFDPQTAHPKLLLSADRKEVRCGDKPQKLSPNPQRFDCCACVLATQRFSSGRHYFQVCVGGKTGWGVGLASEQLNRKGEVCVSPEEGLWTLVMRGGNEYWAADHSPQRLTPPQAGALQTVGVFVDYEGGIVSFYDVENSTLLYTFTDLTFSDRLHPFFSPYNNDGGRNSAPLIITPVNQTAST